MHKMKQYTSAKIRVREITNTKSFTRFTPEIGATSLVSCLRERSATIHYQDRCLHQVSELQDTVIVW
ncbi:hypothetical protein CsatB_021679 [Cannabis sativa]